MSRENKQELFCYLDHRTTDMKFNIITDVHVTPGNVHDSVPYLNREKCFINLEKKKLSEASQTQKSCMGFATVGYGD
jgi:hypothetical protein